MGPSLEFVLKTHPPSHTHSHTRNYSLLDYIMFDDHADFNTKINQITVYLRRIYTVIKLRGFDLKLSI